MNYRSLRIRLLGFISIAIISIISINMYSILRIKSMENQYNDMINKMFVINNINKEINSSKLYLEKYFLTKTDSDLKNYIVHYELAAENVKKLDDYKLNEGFYLVEDLKNTVESFLESSQDAILVFYIYDRGEEFYKRLQETREITTFINEYSLKIQNEYLKYNEQLYKNISQDNSRKNAVLLISVAFMLIFASTFAKLMAKDITEPLNSLTDLSKKVSKGEFDVPELETPEIYELQVVTEGFNAMVKDINDLVKEIQDKAAIEKRLKDEELKNLTAQNMIKESRLKVLQSQINPHFLFNALNSIVLTAVEEEAYNTEKMLNSVAVLLRYSLNMIDHITTIGGEFEIIKEYLFLQSIRFGDRVRFNIKLDEEVLEVKIPGMILQPLVENALTHGIEGMEEGGIINIEALKIRNHCIIKIEDNGAGMSYQKIEEILQGNNISKVHGQTTGLGVGNVVNRLRIFFEDEDVITILSEENKGTKIYVKIPA
ncbi:sensor histidine kinase [Clostridium polynesiense]|uniref:sensor histidine kinase n=1 Tax=Clostridium polynesiense TaxID=1325933 RepID=UPI00058ECAC5|nr:sensor histidine kinase [Clostridium polynesiense]